MYVPILKFIDVLVFEIFDLKMQISISVAMATGVAMATILCSARWGVFLMLPSKYELDTTYRSRVRTTTILH